jgi:hypothetical protein
MGDMGQVMTKALGQLFEPRLEKEFKTILGMEGDYEPLGLGADDVAGTRDVIPGAGAGIGHPGCGCGSGGADGAEEGGSTSTLALFAGRRAKPLVISMVSGSSLFFELF